MVRDINRDKTDRLTHSGEAAGGLGGASRRHMGAQRDLCSPRRYITHAKARHL